MLPLNMLKRRLQSNRSGCHRWLQTGWLNGKVGYVESIVGNNFYVRFLDVGRRITKKKELLLLAQPTVVEAKVDRSGCSTELENKAQAQAGKEARETFGMELAEEQ